MDADKLYNWLKTVAEAQQAKITRREGDFSIHFSKSGRSFSAEGAGTALHCICNENAMAW